MRDYEAVSKQSNNTGAASGSVGEHAMEMRETIAESGEFRWRASGEESERIRAAFASTTPMELDPKINESSSQASGAHK